MLRVAVKFVYRGPSRVLRYNTARLHLSSRNLQSSGLDDAHGRGRAGKFLYFLGTITLASGGTIAYANYDPEFRRWLEENIPYATDVLPLILRDDKPLFAALDSYVVDLKNQVFGMITRREEKLPAMKPEPKPVREEPAEKKPDKQPDKQPDKKSEDALPPEEPKNVGELELVMNHSVKLAIYAYKVAACACRDHGNEIGNIVEQPVDKIDANAWAKLKAQKEKREAALALSEERAKTANENIEKLSMFLGDRKAAVPEAKKEIIRQNILAMQEELANAAKLLENERQRADVADKYWNKVEEARKHFAEELEVLIPSFKVTDRKLKMAEGDLDLFILHAFQNVLYYQKELLKLETVNADRLQKSIEETGGAVDKAIVITQVKTELDKERRIMDAEFQKRSFAQRAESERELRTQLKRQAEAHSDHLRDALAMQEVELSRKFQRTIDEKIADEQGKFKVQIASMMGRLKGLETALKARAEADKAAAQAQLLWSAAESLHSALKAGMPGVPWKQKLRPLEDDIIAVRKAAVEGDELVEAVLAAFPKVAIERGVYTEDALRERFIKVERVCRRLALLPEGGGTLPLYLLSYLQSLFIINAVGPIPKAELSDEPVDLSHLDTFEILQRARYWLDRGNITQTLKYMNLLGGASRTIASDWMREARILLETQLAAGTLLAHAAAVGLIHL